MLGSCSETTAVGLNKDFGEIKPQINRMDTDERGIITHPNGLEPHTPSHSIVPLTVLTLVSRDGPQRGLPNV